MRQQLVGTWHETGGQGREYVLDAGGTFSMKMGGCPDGAAIPTITASGSWSVLERLLVLEVKSTSTPILEGSTMRDMVKEIGTGTLVLESSVGSCAGQQVRLTKS
jgi:hypothetical protein